MLMRTLITAAPLWLCPASRFTDYRLSYIYSESFALLFICNTGIIVDVMGSDDVKFTVSGRMSSGESGYDIDTTGALPNKYHRNVQNTQVEIDVGYESPGAFCICETKNFAVSEALTRRLTIR